MLGAALAGTQGGQVAIVVPVHRTTLDEDARVSLRHLEHYLSGYDRYLVQPAGLGFELEGFGVERFRDSYFASARAYSSLCVSKQFYRRFLAYEYMLIYQLDCLVFADELGEWCSKGYDFVGAVHEIEGVRMVGNGGLSLRRVQRCLAVLTSKRRMVDPGEHWRSHWADKPLSTRVRALPRRLLKHTRAFNGVRWELRKLDQSPRAWGEDWFWSLKAHKYLADFRKASTAEADRFAFFGEPRQTFEQIGRRLPFGCHGWNRFDRAFWEPHLLPNE